MKLAGVQTQTYGHRVSCVSLCTRYTPPDSGSVCSTHPCASSWAASWGALAASATLEAAFAISEGSSQVVLRSCAAWSIAVGEERGVSADESGDAASINGTRTSIWIMDRRQQSADKKAQTTRHALVRCTVVPVRAAFCSNSLPVASSWALYCFGRHSDHRRSICVPEHRRGGEPLGKPTIVRCEFFLRIGNAVFRDAPLCSHQLWEIARPC